MMIYYMYVFWYECVCLPERLPTSIRNNSESGRLWFDYLPHTVNEYDIFAVRQFVSFGKVIRTFSRTAALVFDLLLQNIE